MTKAHHAAPTTALDAQSKPMDNDVDPVERKWTRNMGEDKFVPDHDAQGGDGAESGQDPGGDEEAAESQQML